MRTWRWEKDRFRPCDAPPALRGLLSGVETALLLPPLWDHHGHLLSLGAQLEEVDLRGTASLEAAADRVHASAAFLPPDGWLLGSGWDQERWGGAFPHRTILDAAAAGRPCYLRRIDGHAAWASTEALGRAGLGPGTPDPPGGRFLRDGDGLTGVVVDNAMLPLEAILPAPAEADRVRRAQLGIQALAAAGVAGATDMGLKAADAESLAALDAADRLPLPLDGYLWEEPAECPPLWERPGETFRVLGVKLYADGALGSRGAALTEAYTDEPGSRGLLLHEPAALGEKVRAARARGAEVAVHAIGDAAADAVLDAFESAGGGPAHRLEHGQLLRPDQVERLARLGVAVSLQPCHWLSDRGWAPARLGGRAEWAYRAGSLARAGVPLRLGTDFPIEDPDPRRTLFAARTLDRGEALPFGAALAAASPPAWAVQRCGATVVLGAVPEDLDEPERLLRWELRGLPSGALP